MHQSQKHLSSPRGDVFANCSDDVTTVLFVCLSVCLSVIRSFAVRLRDVDLCRSIFEGASHLSQRCIVGPSFSSKISATEMHRQDVQTRQRNPVDLRA